MPHPPGAPPWAVHRFRFIDIPLNETIYRCFAYGQSTAAERLRADFHVPERRWWRLKIKGLGHARNFEALRVLSLTARSPIGFMLFVEVCMEQGAYDEAARYAA